MNCDDVRMTLRDYQEGRLPTAALGEIRAHLEACPDCTHVDAVEQELTSALEPRLPQRPASLALKRRIKGGAVGYFLDRKAAVLVAGSTSCCGVRAR